MHIHSKNIVHGDLSSSNVLLQSCPARQPVMQCTAKLADFGLSVKMEQGQTHHSRMFQGTPHYTAPEVLQQGVLSKASDLYAVGVLLWELYNGTPPWRRFSAAQQAGGEDEIDMFGTNGPFTLPASCPAQYAALVRRCLSTSAAERPTAEEVLQDVTQQLQRC